ncbi:cytochrome c [candidate division GN15 bacterium]|nr:cytochrome c [candidate division GN15 bacterium]
MPNNNQALKTVRRFWPRCLAAIGVLIAVILIAASIYLYAGWYNIAATEPHLDVTENAIRTFVRASVQNHAGQVASPPSEMAALSDTLAGFAAYDEMCVDCHGAPGIGRSEFGQGLYPLGPSLTERDTIWTDRELFWIVKHGLKMTGMPAFGPTHSDEQIWELVVFTKHLSEMSYYQYLNLQDSLGNAHTHEH